MNLLKRISFFAMISVATSLISFLLLPILTEYLSPEDYGILSIYNAVTRFLIAIIPLGTINILTITLIKDLNLFKKQFKSFLQLSVLNAVLISLLIFVYITVTNSSFFGLPNWLAVATPIFACGVIYYDAFTNISIFRQQRKWFSIFSISKFSIEIGVSLFLIILLGFKWEGRIFGIILSLIISLILGVYYIKKEQLYLPVGTIDKENMYSLIKEGLPLILMTLSITVMNLSDRLFIEKMESLQDVGVYNVGATIASVELIMVSASISVFRPLIYKHLKNKKRDLLLQVTNSFILVTTLFAIFVSSDWIFDNFINVNYSIGKKYVFIIALGFLFWGVYNFYISYVLYYDKHLINAYVSVFGMVLNLILNYVLITRFGTIGAAYATAITYLSMSIIVVITALSIKNKNRIDFFKE